MYIGKRTEENLYKRVSKLGTEHQYTRSRTIFIFRCDNCGNEFERTPKKMHHKRISNNFFHVCSQCDAKRFAQKKGVEQKQIWDMPAGLDLPVSKY